MEGKIFNPASGRWVLKTGAKGKALLKALGNNVNRVVEKVGKPEKAMRTKSKQQKVPKAKGPRTKQPDVQKKTDVQKKAQDKSTKIAQDVHTAGDRLFFYNASANVAPGRGVHEHVADKDIYATLAKIPNWRKVLSNFHLCPFRYTDMTGKALTYRSIEHAFQAEKIRLVDPLAAFSFSVESGTALGTGDGLAARKARKLVNLDKDKIREWDAMSRGVMKRIAEAKYQQCPEACHVLKATNDAELWHLVMRSKTHDHFTHLEQIRSTLS